MKLIWILLFSSLLILSCEKSEDDPPPQTEDPPEVELLARVTGTVRSSTGSPIPNASVHIVYEEIPASLNRNLQPLDDSQVPSQAQLYTFDTMRTECGGTEILPDGITAKIFWDSDGDGIDTDDPQPPLCNHPPACEDGPAYTVNYNHFLTNGFAVGNPGGFITDLDFTSYGDVLNPSRYYVRIFCEDGNPLYTSQLLEIPENFSMHYLTMTCSDCEGTPQPPQWELNPVYPNPVLDETTVHFGVAVTEQTQVWLRQIGKENFDVPVDENLTPGFYDRVLDLSDQPNGAYIYALMTGMFQASDTLIKNVSSESDLRGTTGGAITETNGTFTLNVPCRITTDLRDSDNVSLGEIILNRTRIVATMNGYEIADTTLDLTAETDYTVELILSPQ